MTYIHPNDKAHALERALAAAAPHGKGSKSDTALIASQAVQS